MKRFICLLTVLVLCLSLAAPVFAEEAGFVPSITYKPNPEIVPVEGEIGPPGKSLNIVFWSQWWPI